MSVKAVIVTRGENRFSLYSQQLGCLACMGKWFKSREELISNYPNVEFMEETVEFSVGFKDRAKSILLKNKK